MAEPAWKHRVRARVADAATLLDDARGKLDAAPLHLVAAMGVARAADARSRIQQVMGSLKAVSRDIVVFSALAHAAEIFALRAGSGDPTRPLPYVHLLGAQEPALERALSRLLSTRVRVVDAYRSVDSCRAHLATALLLLDHPGLPDVDSLIDGERGLANTALDSARRDASFCVDQVGIARQDMDGAN